jgi:NAD(P)H-dependent FMN reductase
MLTLQIITVSTRKGRVGPQISAWFQRVAEKHNQFNLELVDLAEINLPMYDENIHPRLQQYEHEHTRQWSKIVSRADAYVFVTPEYNFSVAPSLVNALDYLHHEWSYKPAGFVSYGGVSAGTRGVQVAKQIVTTLHMMPVPEAVNIPFFFQYLDQDAGLFNPPDTQEQAALLMLNELLKWSTALKTIRVDPDVTQEAPAAAIPAARK